jgi:AcrR family transcriptional regulator
VADASSIFHPSVVVLKYHNGMVVPRQPDSRSGRFNQKQRTLSAIVAAARAMLERGETPTVAQAAAEARVSRTTAYRYFPNNESLIRDLSIDIDMQGIDDVSTYDTSEPRDRLVEYVERFNRFVLEHERFYRIATRHWQDNWLSPEISGDNKPDARREGRRRRTLATIFEPLRTSMPTDQLARLEAAMCLVAGNEAVIVLRDVLGLEPDEIIDVTRWATQAILAAAFAP